MKHHILKMSLTLVLMSAVILVFSPSFAKNIKKSGAGVKNAEKQQQKGMSGNHGGGERSDHEASVDNSGRGSMTGGHFSEQNKKYINDYYGQQFRKGRCPPGLAKKGNGCMPPGQAKKWAIGRRLPRDVIFYNLSPTVLEQLGPAPSRHRFVRVAQDILLITVGTGMVIDALEDVGREFNR